jgi:hypothetical protein
MAMAILFSKIFKILNIDLLVLFAILIIVSAIHIYISIYSINDIYNYSINNYMEKKLYLDLYILIKVLIGIENDSIMLR